MAIEMLTRQEGFWISPQGDVEEIIEHLSAVESNPDKFGLHPAQYDEIMSEFSPPFEEGRIEVIRTVLDNGWIRVRGYGQQYIAFTVSELFPDTVARITSFLEESGAWENERVRVTEMVWNSSGLYEVGDFFAGNVVPRKELG